MKPKLFIQQQLLQMGVVLKRLLNKIGLGKFPFVQRIAQLVKQYCLFGLHGPKEIELDGIRLLTPGRFVPQYEQQQYEPLTTNAIREFLRPGMTVVDVGAHIGYYTVLMANLVGPTGVVYAVEPSLDNIEYLHKNIRKNKLTNVEVLTHAAGRTRRTREFHITNSSDCHGFFNHPLKPTIDLIDVLQVPLDESVPLCVDFVKMDIEGGEVDALLGMNQILKANHPIRLVVEWNPACMGMAGFGPDELPKLLSSMGFSLTVLDEKKRWLKSVEEILQLLRENHLKPTWYANLLAERCP